MASRYVVTTSFGLSVPDATSPKNAVEIAQDCPVKLGTGMYEVEEWDDNTGLYVGSTKYFADGTEVEV